MVQRALKEAVVVKPLKKVHFCIEKVHQKEPTKTPTAPILIDPERDDDEPPPYIPVTPAAVLHTPHSKRRERAFAKEKAERDLEVYQSPSMRELHELRDKMAALAENVTNGMQLRSGRTLELSSEQGQSGAAGLHPLREMVNPAPGAGRDGVPATIQTYVPFTSTDLLNWKMHNPSYSEKPQVLTGLVESIMATHQPTWQDLRQLLGTILSTEERRRVDQQAQQWLKAHVPVEEADANGWVAARYPLTNPNWNPNNTAQLELLKWCRNAVVAGMKAGTVKAHNLSKIAEVRQGPDETPGAFLERLYDAYRNYTPWDPEEPCNQRTVNMNFVSQSATDIKRKLQKLEGFAGMNVAQLLEVAMKVYVNRDVEKERQDKKKMKEKAGFLAAALAEGTPVQRGRANLKLPSQAAGVFTLEVPQSEGWRVLAALAELEQPSPLPIGMSELMEMAPPGVWAEGNPPGLAVNATPVMVQIKPQAHIPSIKQYPISRDALLGISTHIERYLQYGLLKCCHSPWNTPLLPVRKPGTSDYRPVQDLRAVNLATETIHPVVPNPYTLLGLIPPEADYFTVLDLKDAFFCVPLAEQSQHIFAFQWQDPYTGTKGQLTWTRLPQGFKNSPTLFGAALAKDLENFPSIPGQCVLLQYVDDLLLATKGREENEKATLQLLHLLYEAGYRVSKKKAQMCQQTVQYLGFTISQRQRALRPERKEAICLIKEPQTRKQLRGFLGAAGFCRIWIPDFGTIAKPLNESTKGGERDPFEWGPDQRAAFNQLKKRLMQAPALGLPNPDKPFQLYVHEQRGVAAGVLTQILGTWKRPVAYLSRQLDPTAKGWPPCLRAVAATALLVQQADKLTFGQEIVVNVPHSVLTLMEYKGSYWLSNDRMAKYQALLCGNPRLKLQVVNTLNPATLLPLPDLEGGPDEHHDCLQVMDEVYSSRPDLKDEPLDNADVEYFTDGSSFIRDGKRYAGYAVTTRWGTMEAKPLPIGTSAQKAEIIALTRALQLSAGCTVNIYTDSKYAFTALHAHAALWKERGLLSASGKPVKYGLELLNLLEAVWAPKEVAVIHCRAHRKGDSIIQKGNRRADLAAKQAAAEDDSTLQMALIPDVLEGVEKPIYTEEEEEFAADEAKEQTEDGWYILKDNRVFVPRAVAIAVVRDMHQSTHYGTSALVDALQRQCYIVGLSQIATTITKACVLCAKNNAKQGPLAPPGVQHIGVIPMESIIVDFTDLPKARGFQYLLVFVDTLTGWVEAYPTRTKKAREITCKLLHEIIPRFGLPRVMGSDNGPEFIAVVVQEISQALDINWKLHSAWRPQSSGKTERMNRTLKAQLAKLCQETHMKWTEALPIALFRIRCSPKRALKLSPFELMYGRPPPLSLRVNSGLVIAGGHALRDQVQCLARVLSSLRRWILERTPISLSEPVHPFTPGDEVWLKEWKDGPLAPRWRGPFLVLLSTPTAVKLDGVAPWIHHTRVKRSEGTWTCSRDPDSDLKLTLHRHNP
ncbi:uncharacterized protein LOC118079408 [Zootoca vivipara]|uniref:uncharacterized protein LOC118079408 n=1 Tax=Zootoca vivipara TaxID=8524 RepID=UPI00159133EE|nr:uncharacterized protein LOC118079408 [Zootoca vivipara]